MMGSHSYFINCGCSNIFFSSRWNGKLANNKTQKVFFSRTIFRASSNYTRSYDTERTQNLHARILTITKKEVYITTFIPDGIIF